MTPTRASDSGKNRRCRPFRSFLCDEKEDPHRRAGIGVRESDRGPPSRMRSSVRTPDRRRALTIEQPAMVNSSRKVSRDTPILSKKSSNRSLGIRTIVAWAALSRHPLHASQGHRLANRRSSREHRSWQEVSHSGLAASATRPGSLQPKQDSAVPAENDGDNWMVMIWSRNGPRRRSPPAVIDSAER